MYTQNNKNKHTHTTIKLNSHPNVNLTCPKNSASILKLTLKNAIIASFTNCHCGLNKLLSIQEYKIVHHSNISRLSLIPLPHNYPVFELNSRYYGTNYIFSISIKFIMHARMQNCKVCVYNELHCELYGLVYKSYVCISITCFVYSSV